MYAQATLVLDGVERATGRRLRGFTSEELAALLAAAAVAAGELARPPSAAYRRQAHSAQEQAMAGRSRE